MSFRKSDPREGNGRILYPRDPREGNGRKVKFC